MFSMRTVVQTYLKLQRLEIFLVVLLPFFLIIESALANGTVYAGGALNFGDGGRSLIAFGRGLFFEILTYAAAKLVKIMLSVRNRRGALLVGFVACWCILVSAGNNLGWVLSGGEFTGVFASMGRVMPGPFLFFYQMGLGLLLPISVGVLALVDVSHLVREALNQSDLDEQALAINESEAHRTMLLKEQKRASKGAREHYRQISEARAQSLVERAKKGDFSFGARDRQPGLTRVQPATSPALGAGSQRPALPAAPQQPPRVMPQQTGWQQPPIQGQVSPASPQHSGNTQILSFGPQPGMVPPPMPQPYR